MKLFVKILILVLSNQLSGSFGYSINTNDSEGMSVVSTTQSPLGKVMKFLNSANFTVKASMTEMCQLMHEYSGMKKIGKISEKSECMRRKLRIEGSENRVECNENPQAEHSIMMAENKPKIPAFGFADILCDTPMFNKTIDAQFDRTLVLFKGIVKPEHVPCMEYKLHELKPESPLIKDYDSPVDLSIVLFCQIFFDTFKSRVIDTLAKQDMAIFDKLNISGCMKINMMDHETKRAYELGLIAMEMPEDQVMDGIKAANFEFKQMFISSMLDCFLNNLYGN